MQKIILGIDPGYGRCGFGIIQEEENGYRSLTHGVITTKKEKSHPARLLEIAEDIEKLIIEFSPEVLVIEELFFSKSTTTALKVAEVRGLILMLAEKFNLAIVQVKPNEVKLAITGYGKADKKQIQEMVKTIFSFKNIPKPDDAADALAIAWCGSRKDIVKYN